jgi:hypothetical protein
MTVQQHCHGGMLCSLLTLSCRALCASVLFHLSRVLNDELVEVDDEAHHNALTGHGQQCVVIIADQRLFCGEQRQETCNPGWTGASKS